MQVTVAWLKDRPEAYQALYKFWASEEFITKSKRARECRGTFGPGHSYGPDGHLRLSKRMVRKICRILHLEFIYGTNSYPQERESGVRPLDIIGRGRIGILRSPTSCALRWRKFDW